MTILPIVLLVLFLGVSFLFGALAAMLVYVAYVFGVTIFVWMLVDAAKNDRYVWLMLMVALPVVMSIVYLLVEKEHLYKHVKPVKG